MDIPLPSGSDTLDGRGLAFNPDSENARIPDCPKHISTTITENKQTIYWGLLGIGGLAVATIIAFTRWKSKSNDELQQ
jgi:hypothetical protein